jgi:hypothetical protein
MNDIYKQAVEPSSEGRRNHSSALGGSTQVLHKMISLKGLTVAFLGLLLIGALGFLSISELKTQARKIVTDTLPGLSFSGAANAYIADSSRTLLYVVSENPEQRTRTRSEIETLSQRTGAYLDKYKNQIFSEEDRTNYLTLLQKRDEYIKIRSHVLDLAMSGNRQAALSNYNEQLIPAQGRVKAAADQLLAFNMKQGEFRGQRIMTICTVTQIFVAVACVLVFTLGFFVGFFK